MPRKSLLWHLVPSYLWIILLSLLLLTLHVSSVWKGFYLSETVTGLQTRAALIEKTLRDSLLTDQKHQIDAICKELGLRSDCRITVISKNGDVLGDSVEKPQDMDNHRDRPEFQQAIQRNLPVGQAIRYSRTLKTDMIYVAIPIVRDSQMLGAIRCAKPMSSLNQAIHRMYLQTAAGGLGVALLAIGISFLVSRKLTRPLERIRRGAERFAQGDLNLHVAVDAPAEITSLADSMNSMARNLEFQIQTILAQRNEQKAVLASMSEGVVAVAPDNRCISINPAAAEWLDVRPDQVIGRDLREVIRNNELQRFVKSALESQHAVEGEIVLHDAPEDRILQIQGTELRDGQGRRIGALIVFSDITRLRKLETIRKDFVANVSHELKTPITSIRGFAETLLDGAIQNPDDAKRFLEIILRQAERLDAIIEDILTLSKIEQQSEKMQITLQQLPIRPALLGAAEICQIKASAKNIAIELNCPEDLKAGINASLLEQAVLNLIDNAVKYSESDRTVSVSAEPKDAELLIHVKDQGCGIEQELLPRLFERFYRVDKGRSRQQGGTGLGLAIVKHIAQAHNGHVSVSSQIGKGSIFTIHLPR